MRAGEVLFGVVCAVCHDSHDYMDYCQCQCQCQCGTILLLLLEQQQLLSGLSSSSSLCGVPQLPASLTASSFRRPVSGTVYGLFSYATYDGGFVWFVWVVRVWFGWFAWCARNKTLGIQPPIVAVALCLGWERGKSGEMSHLEQSRP